ncbi:MAG: SMC-Scp complex subunit ScpB [Cellvibrionaceae bacterium]|nr:SMC-Scp complex subunit ScpB [Cellvibrionaceae bacterium]
MSYDPQLLQRIVEGALLAAGEALSLDRIMSLFDEAERPEKQEILDALAALRDACAARGFELAEVASGWRFQVATDLAPWVNRLWEEKPQKYSRALLETLALIAYRQPITRSDIEEVRGVAVSSHIIKTLAEREWIKVVGHRDVPGRPSLYATTRQFLDYFGLKSLEELPTLGELKDIDSLNQALELGDEELIEEREQIAAAKDADEPTTESLFDQLDNETPQTDGQPETDDTISQADAISSTDAIPSADDNPSTDGPTEVDSHTDDSDSAFEQAESDKSID